MRTLLVGKVGVVDGGDRHLVRAVQENASQFGPGRVGASRQNQRDVTKIDEGNLAAVLDAPAVPQVSGKAGLATVRDPSSRYL